MWMGSVSSSNSAGEAADAEPPMPRAQRPERNSAISSTLPSLLQEEPYARAPHAPVRDAVPLKQPKPAVPPSFGAREVPLLQACEVPSKQLAHSVVRGEVDWRPSVLVSRARASAALH